MAANKNAELQKSRDSSLIQTGQSNAPTDPTRRQFVNQALAVSAGVALSGLVPQVDRPARSLSYSGRRILCYRTVVWPRAPKAVIKERRP